MFWRVWEMVLDEGASARGIAEATKGDRNFVNREKAGVIVKAIRADEAAARRALAGRQTPPGFRPPPRGIRLPSL